MNSTTTGDWVPFGKPIKTLCTQRNGQTEPDLILAWRVCYEDQPKAFEPISISGIEYLGFAGDIFWWEDIEILEEEQ